MTLAEASSTALHRETLAHDTLVSDDGVHSKLS
jgi:hypothetical protein